MRAAIFQATDGVSEPGDDESAEHESAEHESAARGSAEHGHESAEHKSRANPSDNIIHCFQNHEDAVSIATLDDDDITLNC